MAFFNQAISILQTLVVAIGAVLQYGELLIFWKDTATTILGLSHRESSSLWLVAVWH